MEKENTKLDFGVGLVSYQMSENEIVSLTESIKKEKPKYLVVMDHSPKDISKDIFILNGWTYYHNPKNPGFGAGHNSIYSKYSSLSKYHLVINPDIIIKDLIISELIDFLEITPDSGCVIPKVLYTGGKVQMVAKLLPSPLDLILRRLPVKKIRKKVNHYLELNSGNNNDLIFKSPFLSGCFLLLKNKSFQNKDKIFDERYFMYMEDLDLCRELWMNRNFPYYYGKVEIYHGYQKGSSKSAKLFIVHIFSAIKYFLKWPNEKRNRKYINQQCLEELSKI